MNVPEAITRQVAALGYHAVIYDDSVCNFCADWDADRGAPWTDPRRHGPACPFIAASFWVKENPE